MTKQKGIGKGGLLLCALAMVAMCAVSFWLRPDRRISGELGICLPSPNLWTINPVSSWLINTVMLGGCAAAGFFLNRTYNFIRSTHPVLSSLFLVLAASNPWITGYLSSSTLLCVINLLCITIMFRTFRSGNATQEMFVISTFISVGSMFQHAFLPMIVAYIGSAIVMKVFRFKECLAMLMGLVAPYWVGIGLGLIPLEWFRMPQITNLFIDYAHASDLFLLVFSVGLAIFCGFILGINNSIKLYAGNSQVNAMNLTITFVGVVSSVCVFIDFSNMMAYVATIYFSLAVQMANLCALWNVKRERLVVAIPAIIYIGFFIAMVLN
ncbi:MAG: hypothetical protein HDR88_10710 [Bacteroides sp.]|nr:hypothetical protein [Bacteroides sp.]